MLIGSIYQTNGSSPTNAPQIKFTELGRKFKMMSARLYHGSMISPAFQVQLSKICPVLTVISLRKTPQAAGSNTDALLNSGLLFTSFIQAFMYPWWGNIPLQWCRTYLNLDIGSGWTLGDNRWRLHMFLSLLKMHCLTMSTLPYNW